MTDIHYRDQLAAVVDGWTVLLSPHINTLEGDHPDRRWVETLATFAALIADGSIEGPYDAEAAAEYARGVLMPAREVAALADFSDADLAEAFGAPLDQVQRRRQQLCDRGSRSLGDG